jgi:branched-chain amino acid aminotransferase
VTPKSSSILPSITNLSLMQLARDNGMVVEQRPIQFDELKDFVEVGACGTAVVISPIKRIFRGEHVIEIQKEQGFGPQLKKLHDTLRSIQTGDLADRHGWLVSL